MPPAVTGDPRDPAAVPPRLGQSQIEMRGRWRIQALNVGVAMGSSGPASLMGRYFESGGMMGTGISFTFAATRIAASPALR